MLSFLCFGGICLGIPLDLALNEILMCKTNNTVCTVTLGFSLLWLWIDQKLWSDEKLYISIKTTLLVLAKMALLKCFRQLNFESRCPLSSAAFRKVENFEFLFDLLRSSFQPPSKLYYPTRITSKSNLLLFLFF